MKKVIGYMRLTRPANILTAIADILLGYGISGKVSAQEWSFDISDLFSLLMLAAATSGLYASGVVFNDIFDAELDRKERPERPIPSGVISTKEATSLACFLLIGGVFFASLVSNASLLIATIIGGMALLYNGWSKHHNILGPINMGLCRGANLLLGASVIYDSVLSNWYVALIPILFIAAITFISHGEVNGGNRTSLSIAMLMYGFVITAICIMAYERQKLIAVAPFLFIFSFIVLFSLFKAFQTLGAGEIRRAVKYGVLSLIIMDASIGAAFTNFSYGLLILLLLPLSLIIAKKFAVT